MSNRDIAKSLIDQIPESGVNFYMQLLPKMSLQRADHYQ
jgi:hypothetical protein